MRRHPDTAKLTLIALIMLPYMRLAVSLASNTSDDDILFPVVGFVGVALCGGAAYWLGNRKWILIPPLAMLMEIAFAIPATMGDPSGGETPLSVVLEAPFWTGIPALLGASVGYAIKRAHG